MATRINSGTCRLCGRTFGKRQMTTHVKACWKGRIAGASPKAKRSWFLLVVEGRHSPKYWLHLQVPAKSTFGDLDGVLRAVWVECCGHLSAFEFPVRRRPQGMESILDCLRLSSKPDWGSMADWECDDDEELMDKSVGSKLEPGTVFSYQYDFGTTTNLALRVLDEYNSPAVKGSIKVLARNEPPVFLCSVCQKPATQLCQECGYSSEAPLCDACASKHKCDESMLVPLLNSPRSGVCGYYGPSIEP